ncbi:iron uptake system protein EfeO [Thiomonas intermedia]|uniref:iron uptake system protein EfeO n=1 Tax=Thiomonas intermedia TaxID=926 RepID=UPI0009A4FD5B|nr:iron uptake system protein EfeO [Thiomonas intermedia]
MNTPPPAPHRFWMRAALVASALVLIAAGAAFYYASQLAHDKAPNQGDEIIVTIHARHCEPNALTVPAGTTQFRIVNQSDRAVEWEILDGVMVVEERENIAPGLSTRLTTRLEPGDYAITCGLLSNPRGTLKVTPTTESSATAKAAPTTAAFIGPLAEQRFDLTMRSDDLLEAASALRLAIEAGQLDAARAAYLKARIDYQHIAATAQRYGDLDNAINARADYFAQREKDPAFGGFHRIEYGLFAENSTAGLLPVATKLNADLTALRTAMLARPLPPQQLALNAERLMRSLAQTRSQGEEERYSHADLAGFAANLDSVNKTLALLQPLLVKADPKLLAQLQTETANLASTLGGLHGTEGYRPYDQVDASTRQRIAQQANLLAQSLGAVNGALGLSTT